MKLVSKCGATRVLAFIGNTDAKFYIKEILGRTLLLFIWAAGPDGHRFPQDNDLKHLSKLAKEFMEFSGIHWWKTPSESLDLNPKERLWNGLKHFLRKNFLNRRMTSFAYRWHKINSSINLLVFYHKWHSLIGYATYYLFLCTSGLLIFCAVAELQISSKSAKSREIQKTREIPRNSLEILPNTCRFNIFESYLGCWGCLLALNLLIYLETSSLQRVNNIPQTTRRS